MASLQAVVADSSAICRIGFARILEHPGLGFDVTETDSLASLIGELESAECHLLVVDIGLPGLSGISGLREIRGRYPHLKVVVTANDFTKEQMLDCLSSGFHGCVEKSLPAAEVWEALHGAANGKVYISHPLDQVAPVVRPTNPADDLTPRQKAVMHELIGGKSNKEIARSLGITEGTVKVHVNAAYRVLGVRNRVGAVTMLQENTGARSSEYQPRLPALNFSRPSGMVHSMSSSWSG